MAHDADLAMQPRSRRNLLAVAGAGAAAAIATLVSGNRVRAGHDADDGADGLHLDRENAAEGTTALITDGAPSSLYVRNNGGGDALELESNGQVMVARYLGDTPNHTVQVEHEVEAGGAALFAVANGTAIEAQSTVDGSGVSGDSVAGPGVSGHSLGGPGVSGHCDTGPGVEGHSSSGPGVTGHSVTGPGGTFGTDDGESIVHIGGQASSFAVGVDNGKSVETAGGILVNSRGGKPGVEADVFQLDEDHRGIGVQGVSYSGSSYEDGAFAEGPGTGVQGLSGSGSGVEGRSGSGTGVVGHSQSGTGGTFHTDSGDFAANIGGNAVEFALGVHNTLHGDRAGGILSTSAGAKPGIEADVFPFDDDHPGVGVQGVAYLGTGYEDGVFGAGPGTGVEGISGTGTGVRGHSDSGHGGSFESGSGFGVEAHSQDLVGVGGFSVNDLGVLGIGGTDDSGAEGDGVGGFSFHSVAGRFVSFDGIGVRAVSPGENKPALQAASGSPTGQHAEPDSDGGLALEVIGKARFSTAGAAVLPQGQSSVFVSNAAVTEHSHITVTLAGDPGNRHLRWVERDPGNGFTVHLSFAPPSQRPETPLTYLIVEPGGG